MLPYIDAEELVFDAVDTYVLVTRHAVTQGMYAPGKFCIGVASFITSQKRVILVYFGKIDETFAALTSNDNFTHATVGALIPSLCRLEK